LRGNGRSSVGLNVVYGVKKTKSPKVKSNQIKSLFESGKSPYTQTHTHVHKTQYTIKEETIKL